MARTRAVLGLIAGVFLVLSSAAHSLLGWPQIAAELGKTNVPADLARGLRIGWHFGGVAMLVFGILVAAEFSGRLRGRGATALPAWVIGLSYLGFGAWALAASRLEPFFLVFVVPGLLLVLAAAPGASPGPGARA